MKLKLLSYLMPAKTTAPKGEVDSQEEEGAAAPAPEEEGAPAPAPEEEGAPAPEVAPAPAPEEEEETATAQMVNHINAMSAHVAHLTAEVAKLTGTHTAEVDAAVAKKAAQITAGQGVPASAVGGVAAEYSAADAPKDRAEFLAAYSKMTDPAKAGAYYARFNSVK